MPSYSVTFESETSEAEMREILNPAGVKIVDIEGYVITVEGPKSLDIKPMLEILPKVRRVDQVLVYKSFE